MQSVSNTGTREGIWSAGGCLTWCPKAQSALPKSFLINMYQSNSIISLHLQTVFYTLSLLILDLTSFSCGYLWLFTFTALEGFKESSWHWRGYHFSCFIYTAIYIYRGIYTFKGIYISISDSILSQGSGKLQIPGLIFLQKVSFLMPVSYEVVKRVKYGLFWAVWWIL